MHRRCYFRIIRCGGLAPYIQAKNFVENIPNKPAEYLSENLLLATSLEKGKLCELISS